MGRAARPLHDPGNHGSVERGSNLQAARRGGLMKPAKPAGEREITAALTPSLGTRSNHLLHAALYLLAAVGEGGFTIMGQQPLQRLAHGGGLARQAPAAGLRLPKTPERATLAQITRTVGRDASMCKLCDEGQPRNHFGSRRNFLKGVAATGVAAAGLDLFAARPAAADGGDPPSDSGRPGRRYLIRGGSVMSLDPQVGDFARADVLVEGKKILAVGPNLHAGAAAVIDASGRIVMPGFIDTHHHQFETVLRSFLADGILINDGSNTPSGNTTYYEFILQKFAPVYRPKDVYISELFGGLSQLDAGVTTVHDISQIHHSPAHSDAAIQALFDTGRRAAFGFFESASGVAGNQYPSDAFRIKKQWFSSNDQLVHMIMGGEVYLGELTYTQAWQIGRQLGLQIAAHILSPFGIRP